MPISEKSLKYFIFSQIWTWFTVIYSWLKEQPHSILLIKSKQLRSYQTIFHAILRNALQMFHTNCIWVRVCIYSLIKSNKLLMRKKAYILVFLFTYHVYKEFSQNFEACHMTVLMLQMGLTLNRIILELLSNLFYLLMFTFSLAPIS